MKFIGETKVYKKIANETTYTYIPAQCCNVLMQRNEQNRRKMIMLLFTFSEYVNISVIRNKNCINNVHISTYIYIH